MTGTFAGQYAMQGFINIKWAPWKRTMLTRSIALVPALFVAISAQGKIFESETKHQFFSNLKFH